ncbi:hypothetical protein D9753_20925 [Streptomyces dangxiongensis]|uniref:Integral membrane protein n=1 Tax=Streptomyces dangxiongensis TaxID=1442032 RepID=A0A3G2JF09_9ACTN|nr:hypothetical protein [Streptomyces dangxiongensis]AYN40933.1 hypothetical protein D9753_20925 [Streptomyces dangxiongensis]
MQGHGYGQPVKQPPHTAWLVLLRVLFVALGFLTIGFLAWAMLLRLAAVTRRPLDWGLFVAALAADILSTALLAAEPGDDIHTAGGYTGILLLLGTLVATTAYYLAADIRHFMVRQQAYGARQQAYRAPQQAPAYGYPAAATPYTAATIPTLPTAATPTAPTRPAHTPTGPAHPTAPHTHTPPPVPHTPVPPSLAPAPPQRPAPARIDQVRAELDELSDYLRRHDGHEDGR